MNAATPLARPRGPGRPTSYDPKLGANIARRVADGATFARAAKAAGVPLATAYSWRSRVENFAALLACAMYVKATREIEAVLSRRLGVRSESADSVRGYLISPHDELRIPVDQEPDVDVLDGDDSADVVENWGEVLEVKPLSTDELERFAQAVERNDFIALTLFRNLWPAINKRGDVRLWMPK